MTDFNESIRRAAVLITCLEETDARALLARLGSVSADRLRQAIATLGPVAAPERENVMRAFLLSQHSFAERHAQGVELDEALARRLSAVDEPGTTDANAPPRDASAQAPFAFLLATEAEIVAPFLARENPQTIAVVLSFLERRQAAELLRRLQPNIQRQVLTRLAKLDEVDPASVDVLAAELQSWLSRQREVPPATGQDRLVRDLLANGGEQDRNKLIAELQNATRSNRRPQRPTSETQQPASARTDRNHRSIAFDELSHLPSEDLLQVIRAAPEEMLTLALAGADEQLIGCVTNLLSRRDGRRLRRGIQLQGPTRLADIEDAQRRIAMIAVKVLAEKGRMFRSQDAGNAAKPLAAHWA